jgi:hypothetical protein
MGYIERERNKEVPQRGKLYFLFYPSSDIFSGYGLTTKEGRKDYLVGLLMVDRPHPVDPAWLKQIEETYGEYQLVPMTAAGERGIACQMRVAKDSLPLLRPSLDPKAKEIETALKPLLNQPPAPILKVHWNPNLNLWQSEFWIGLPQEMQKVFEKMGYGCFAAEREDMVAFITHAPNQDIESFRNAPVLYHWELIKMPTAPLIRFRATIFDDPDFPYLLEHFLNVADPDQARCLSRLVRQEEIAFDFFKEDYEYAYSKHLPHPEKMRRDLHELVRQAVEHWGKIPKEQRDFDQAKAEFQRRFAP